jgi:hypothetical protein
MPQVWNAAWREVNKTPASHQFSSAKQVSLADSNPMESDLAEVVKTWKYINFHVEFRIFQEKLAKEDSVARATLVQAGFTPAKSQHWDSCLLSFMADQLAKANVESSNITSKEIRAHLTRWLKDPRALLEFIRPGRFPPALILLMPKGAMHQ